MNQTYRKMINYIVYGGTKPDNISEARWNAMCKFVSIRFKND